MSKNKTDRQAERLKLSEFKERVSDGLENGNAGDLSISKAFIATIEKAEDIMPINFIWQKI